MSEREKIQAAALAKKIPLLVHFTRAENVQSIMENGLLPVSMARENGIKPVVNDEMRLDGRMNGTSLSIAFPNGSLFYRFRNDNPGVDWVILAISNSVLWSKEVLFCRHNAADCRISNLSSDELRTADAFAAMFDEAEGIETRASQGLKDFDPTDVQAEALVMEPIEPEFILGALFNDSIAKERYSNHFGKRKLLVHQGRKGFFANRTYYRKFGGG